MSQTKYVLLGLFLLLLSQSVVVVLADVPSVLSITTKNEGENMLLEIKVRHNNPTQNHFIDKINVDVDGTIKSFTNLTKPSVSEFVFTINLGNISPKNLKVQANCNLHGSSSWYAESFPSPTPSPTITPTPVPTPTIIPSPTPTNGDGTSGIPGFSFEAIIIGLFVAILILSIKQKF